MPPSRPETRFIFVTGGVVSALGKGIAAASLGHLLVARGLSVTIQKFDPYINVDPGTMSPFQHGEVFVTEDGAETDLDLGHYERFTDVNTSARLQRHRRRDLQLGDPARAPRRLPRRHRPGDPAHHRRDQEPHPAGGRVGRRRHRHHRDRRHGRATSSRCRSSRRCASSTRTWGATAACSSTSRSCPSSATPASSRPSPPSTPSRSCAASASSRTWSCAAPRRRSAREIREKIALFANLPVRVGGLGARRRLDLQGPARVRRRGRGRPRARPLRHRGPAARPVRLGGARASASEPPPRRCGSGWSASTTSWPTPTCR